MGSRVSSSILLAKQLKQRELSRIGCVAPLHFVCGIIARPILRNPKRFFFIFKAPENGKGRPDWCPRIHMFWTPTHTCGVPKDRLATGGKKERGIRSLANVVAAHILFPCILTLFKDVGANFLCL
jgi:hypothetical protein